MPLHCVGERRSPSQLDGDGEDQVQCTSIWQEVPDSILLHIFSFLEAHTLTAISQICKVWNRVANDETLWRSLLRVRLCEPSCSLAPRKVSWKQEYKRVYYHSPVVHTETLSEHTDEVLHVSFAHGGHLFSTTSKDATLRVWSVGNPTTMKYMKDFRELFGWDFTQFSCFNKSDTMLLVSSVKTTDYMDRRGYMAIMSLIHDFEILRLVTMDPSQLFGAWLDDNTFLGGCLEISLDRFATTVQIEAYEVPEIFSPLPRPAPVVAVEDTSGRPLFTFSSETASLIKFLSVAAVVPSCSSCSSRSEPVKMGPAGSCMSRSGNVVEKSSNQCAKSCDKHNNSGHVASCSGLLSIGETVDDVTSVTMTTSGSNSRVSPCHSIKVDKDKETCDDLEVVKTLGALTDNGEDSDASVTTRRKKIKVDCSDSKSLNMKSTSEGNLECSLDLCDTNLASNSCSCDKIESGKVMDTLDNSEVLAQTENSKLIDTHDKFNVIADSEIKPINPSGDSDVINPTVQSKNLIFVTGEFAVALHQLGFKNVPPINESSTRRTTLNDQNVGDGYMVVNYSNNNIHIVQRQESPDKPDNLIDLFGHVTGLCLSEDQRYLYINCRPWIGDVDRSDPWATPDLSPNIEVRIIDLLTLKDVGVRYVGHKGYSPSTMCCFVFLDVSQDYVASGSEDSKGYLWDKHYHSLLANFEHESGVVNAVGFNPVNQEYLVTVCDDGTIKVWRSRHQAKQISDAQT